MNLLTDAAILIEYTADPKGGGTIRKTILGTTVNIAAAFVLVFEKHPDLAEAMQGALNTYQVLQQKKK